MNICGRNCYGCYMRIHSVAVKRLSHLVWILAPYRYRTWAHLKLLCFSNDQSSYLWEHLLSEAQRKQTKRQLNPSTRFPLQPDRQVKAPPRLLLIAQFKCMRLRRLELHFRNVAGTRDVTFILLLSGCLSPPGCIFFYLISCILFVL